MECSVLIGIKEIKGSVLRIKCLQVQMTSLVIISLLFISLIPIRFLFFSYTFFCNFIMTGEPTYTVAKSRTKFGPNLIHSHRAMDAYLHLKRPTCCHAYRLNR